MKTIKLDKLLLFRNIVKFKSLILNRSTNFTCGFLKKISLTKNTVSKEKSDEELILLPL
jgi:hypothetical protein